MLWLGVRHEQGHTLLLRYLAHEQGTSLVLISSSCQSKQLQRFTSSRETRFSHPPYPVHFRRLG